MAEITGTGATALPAPSGGGIWYAGFGHHLLDAPAVMADLVCAFNLDDSSGSLLDRWRRRYATPSGTLGYGGVGKHGDAVDFETGSAALHLAQVQPDFTVSLWIYRDAGEKGGAFCALWATDLQKVQLKEATGAYADKLVLSSALRSAYGTTTLDEDAWEHLVVRRSANTMTVWLNGAKEIEDTTYQWAMDLVGGCDFVIAGESPAGLPSQGHHLDEVYLWNRALTDAQIAALYNGGDGRFLGENMSGEAEPVAPLPTVDGVAYYIPAGLDHAAWGAASAPGAPAADGAGYREITGTGAVTLPTCYGLGSELAYAFPDMTVEGYQAYLRRAFKLEDLASPVRDQVTYEAVPGSGTIVYRQDGKHGKGIVCNGGWIRLPAEEVAEDFSISLWFKYTDQTAGPLIQAYTNADNYINVQLTQQGLLAQGQAGPGVAISAEYATTFTEGWHHLVLRRQIISTSKEVTLHLDGVEVIDSTDAGWGADLEPCTLELCGDLGPVVTLDEVYRWDEAISDAAIADLYRGGTGTFYVPTRHLNQGAVTLPSPTAIGRGVWPVNGTGAVTLPAVTADGSRWAHTGTGEVELPAVEHAATPLRGILGSGVDTLPLITASGRGVRGGGAEGDVTLPLATARGYGDQDILRTGAGAVDLPGVTGRGRSGLFTLLTGSGAVDLPLATASGQSGLGTLRTGSGAVDLAVVTADGVAVLEMLLTGSGAVDLPLATAEGMAELDVLRTGSGAVALPLVTADGVARRMDLWTGSGAVDLPMVAGSGASARTVVAVGAAEAALVEAAGVLVRIKTGQGAAELLLPSADGAARFVLSGAGAVELPLPTVDSAAIQSLRAEGAPELAIPVADGETLRGVVARGAVALPATEGYGRTMAETEREFQMYRVVQILHVPGQAFKLVVIEATRRPLDL